MRLHSKLSGINVKNKKIFVSAFIRVRFNYLLKICTKKITKILKLFIHKHLRESLVFCL